MSRLGRIWGRLRPPRTDVAEAVRRALLATLEGDLVAAERALTAAARAQPEDATLFRALALVYRRRGELGRAIQIRQALLVRPDLGSDERLAVLADLAEDHRRAGFLRRAVAAWEEVLVHAPRHRGALQGLSRLLVELREHPRAREVARRLARLEGRSSGAEEAALRVEEAEAAHAEGRSDEALRLLRRALRAERGHAPALVLLGTIEAERGRDAQALAAWREAAARDPRTGPFVYPRLEAAYAALGRPREFESVMRKLLEQRPDDVPARLALGRALVARGEEAAAVAELRAAVEHEPEALDAQAALVRVLREGGRTDEAEPVLRELLLRLEREGAVSRESSA